MIASLTLTRVSDPRAGLAWRGSSGLLRALCWRSPCRVFACRFGLTLCLDRDTMLPVRWAFLFPLSGLGAAMRVPPLSLGLRASRVPESDFLPVSPDWEECEVAGLLARAKRLKYFDQIILDALQLHHDDGYSWVCALALALDQWEDPPLYPVAHHVGNIPRSLGRGRPHDWQGPAVLSRDARRVALFAWSCPWFTVDVVACLLSMTARAVTDGACDLISAGVRFDGA